VSTSPWRAGVPLLTVACESGRMGCDGWASTTPAPPPDPLTVCVWANLLDAMPDATAVMGHDGTILAVNNAWRMFGVDNGGTEAATGVGINYLGVCRRSAAAGCRDAAAVHEALELVLKGATVESLLDYPCPSPAVGRWFRLRVTPIAGPTASVLISHTNITEQKTLELELERRASSDPLTGLANRARFLQKVASAATPRPGRRRDADRYGLLYLDLDFFKPINDTFGHAAGDQVLQTVAARLSDVVRPQDTIARLGGDEFAIVAPRISAGGLGTLLARVDAALAEPHLVHGNVLSVRASVGSYLAKQGQTAAESLEHADQAMYTIKRLRSTRTPPS